MINEKIRRIDMKQITMSEKTIKKYQKYLLEEEKSKSTVEKYIRDIIKFYEYLPTSKLINKEEILNFKSSLEEQYKITSVNSMLVALNGFLNFLDLNKLKVKLYKIQRKVFSDQNRELTKQEYMRLLSTAKLQSDDRLYMLIQTMCGTGIRVSEHKAITVEALKRGKAEINNKGKIREIYFNKVIRKGLLEYCKRHRIIGGSIFITKNGKPLDRSNIWKMMKSICKEARVDSKKVFPHNLRHLFALTYYRLEKDLVRLAGLLGHSNIETTRVYTMSKGADCMRSVEKLGLFPHETEWIKI